MNRLSVIGLGKLGACTASCFAYRGFDVIGVDINKDFIDAINQGRAPVDEPRLQELISSAGNKLRATDDYEEAINSSDITFLIVPTPSRDDGQFANDYMMSALAPLAQALKKSSKPYHLFVITSTVSPGSTEKILIPLIERYSGRELNNGFGVCYNPEFIALGSVITNFLNPDMVLIGESSAVAGEMLERVYEKGCENSPCIARMSVISAEITKISLNSYITMKISFANTLANICEKVSGADIDDITQALGSDRRISPYYLKGGLGFGGPCFPRDNRAFAAFAKDYGIDAKLAKATDEVNRSQIGHLVKFVMKHLDNMKERTVAILGLAYKPNTPVIEESPSIRLIEKLIENKILVTVYDPGAMDESRSKLGNKVIYASSVKECFEKASTVVIATRAPEFRNISEINIVNNPTTVIDCWRMLDAKTLGSKIRYVPLGKAFL